MLPLEFLHTHVALQATVWAGVLKAGMGGPSLGPTSLGDTLVCMREKVFSVAASRLWNPLPREATTNPNFVQSEKTFSKIL